MHPARIIYGANLLLLHAYSLAPDLGQCGKLATFFAPTAGKELRELRYRCLSSLFQLMLKPPLTGGLLEGAAYAFIEVSSGDSSSSIIFDDAVKLLKDCAILLRINPWKAGSVVELSVFQGLAAVLEVPDEFGVRTMPVRAAEQVKCLQISITNLMPKILQKIPEVLSQDPGNILWVLLRHQLQNVKPDWQILLPTLKCMTELLDKYEKPPSHVLKCVCESVLALVGAVVEGGGEEVQDDCTFALAQFVTLLYRLHTASLPSPAYLLPALVLFCQGMHQPLTEAQVVLPKSVLRSVAACYSENIVGIKFLSALVGLMDIPELQQEAVECILSASKHVLRANPMWLPKEQVPTVGPVSEAALRETLSATVQLAKSPAPLGSPMLLSRVTFAIGARLLPYPSGQEVIAALDPISDMILIFRDFCELLLNRLEKGDKIQDGLISLVVDCSAAILHSLGEFLAKAGAPFRRKEILRQTVDLACLVSLRWVSSSHGAGTHRWPSQKSILQPDSKVHFFRQRTLLEVKSLPLHHRVFVLASNWEGTDPDPVPQHIALYLKFGMTNPEQNIQVMALREFPVLVEQALCTCGIDIWGPVFQPIVQAACKHEDEDVRVEMALALWQTALSFDLVEGPPPLEASCEITCQNDVVEVFSLGSDALKLKGSGMVPRLLFPFAVVLLKDSAVRVRTYAAHLAARIMSCERASVNIGAADAASFIAAVLEGLVPGSEGSPGTMALLVGELSAGSCMLAKLLEMMAPEGAGGGLGHMMTFFQSKLSAASAGVQSGSPESHIECMVLLQALGCIASSVDIDVAAGCSLFCWIMVLLIDIWTQKSLAIVHLALDQLLHIVRCARVPLWRVLEDDSRSERILPALVEKLLYHKESFTEFVSKVMEGGRDLKDFLTRHCRHILPTFVVNGKRSCLDQLASLYDEVLGNEISRLRLLTPGKSLASVFLYDVKGYGLASILRAVLLKGATEQRKDWSEFCILTDTYFQGNSPEALLKSTERKVVELLAWDLGGSEADTAMKALGRAAILVVGGDSANGTPMGSLSPNPKLSQLIANHFLFLMTHFTFKTRASRCAADEVKAIAVLGRLVQSMDPVRCAHFAPKIFSTLTAALAEPRESPALKEVAYTVLCGFVRGLPDSSFGSHPSLSTVVVALLPALSGVPKPLPQRVCDEVKSLLRYLIVTKRDTLKTYFKTIPFLPALPELEDVSSSLAAENGEPSLPEQLHELHSILQKEDSSSVRQATLGHLLYVLTQSRSELCALIVSGDSVHDSIVQLLSLLLRISSSVSDAKVSNLCAACLGHLGAIDPSRLLFSSARGEAMAKSAALGSASWNMDVLSMSLVLLRDHLVPCLRAAPASIDRVAFGIQELLSLIYREMGCRSSASVLQPGPNRGPMPGGVSDILKENGILDAVEPFWNSEYDVNEQSVSSPPFFSKGSLSLERWMSVWCRHLISSSCGPLKEVFRACRGAVRAHLGTANFLLPHLVCDAVLFGEDSDRAAAAEEVTSVLSEAAKVHKSDSSSGMKGADVQHIAVQCVFSLLDQLTKWSSREENKTSVVRESWRSTDGTRAGALTSFLQNIPWELLVSASKHIRAYTRALLYLEDHIRSSHKRDHAQSKGGVPNYRDGANGELPILGAMHVHELQSIYRNIREEPDGMLGLEVMRRIHMCPRTVKQRIWQYEHAEEWADALQMYEQALRDEEDDQWCFGEREQGVLRCLMELGHFELLLHQAGGILASSSSLGPLLLPLAVDAAWRLQRWPLAEELLRKCDTEVKNFSSRSVSSSATAKKLFGSNLSCVTFGRVLLSLKSDSPSRFREIMESAHAEVMAQLGAASMESYQRAYPFLLRLHMLTEVEDGFRSRSSRGTVRAEDIEKLEWGARLSALTPNLREILPLLAVRQAIMQQHGLTELCIDNWLCLGREARVAGQFSVAALALQKAGILDANAQAKQRLIIQEGKLAHAQGRIDEAILLLEPIDKDVNRLREESRSCRTPDAKRQFSRRLLLATKWIVEAGQRHGTEVLRRYDLALSLHPSEKCYFALGQYNDFLYRAQLCATSDTGGSSAARPGKGLEADEVAQKYLISTLDAYAKSLMVSARMVLL
jgi:tetratricopeptide (TPR) repeat protein